MTIRYVMCFTVHYLKKKTWQKKNSNGLSQTAHFTWRSSLERISWAHCGVESAYLAAMLPCFLMSSHVIPCYPKMAKRRKYGNWKFWDPNHPILSRVIGMIPSCDLQKWPGGQTLPRARCKYPRPPWPNAPSSSDCWDPSSRAFAKGWWLGVTIHGGNLCNSMGFLVTFVYDMSDMSASCSYSRFLTKRKALQSLSWTTKKFSSLGLCQSSVMEISIDCQQNTVPKKLSNKK